jgi:hypothetical protein
LSTVIGAFSIVAFFIAVRQRGRRDADARQVRAVVDVGGAKTFYEQFHA